MALGDVEHALAGALAAEDADEHHCARRLTDVDEATRAGQPRAEVVAAARLAIALPGGLHQRQPARRATTGFRCGGQEAIFQRKPDAHSTLL